jgi:hypothetical protein
VRGKRRAEERATRAAEKAAKEESKRQEELRSYKGLMRVRSSAGMLSLVGSAVPVVVTVHVGGRVRRSAGMLRVVTAMLLPFCCGLLC